MNIVTNCQFSPFGIFIDKLAVSPLPKF